MGFLHQLHLLLWKNVTLKRRSPWVLAFEIFIPLVLFFILLGLRQKKPTISVKEVCKFQPLSAPFPSNDPQTSLGNADRFLAASLIPLPLSVCSPLFRALGWLWGARWDILLGSWHISQCFLRFSLGISAACIVSPLLPVCTVSLLTP
uniref:ATP binding cassette subfamily A member 2 n=1 Tax=Sarcophilus harrisii TaxID=9305 RepID=G3W4R8_SARHA